MTSDITIQCMNIICYSWDSRRVFTVQGVCVVFQMSAEFLCWNLFDEYQMKKSFGGVYLSLESVHCVWCFFIIKEDAGKGFEKIWWPRKVAKLTTAKFCWNSYISWSRLVFDNKGRKLLNISFNFQLFALMIKDVSQMNARFWEDFELILFANILNDKFSERE